MPQMHAVVGQKLYIGNTQMALQSSYVESDFSGQTWTEIKGWVTRGETGTQFALVTSDQVSEDYTAKDKGTGNSGSMANVFDIIDGDAGQAALRAAALERANYAFKVEDKLRSGQSTPKTELFVGLAMSRSRPGGGPNDPDRFASTIEIQKNIVPVAAT